MANLASAYRKSGIEVMGDIPWGTHFCQFYETKEDLLELLIPFFKAGLESNEYCFWITWDPVTVEDAFAALKQAIPSFDQYLEKKSIEVVSYMDWYLRSGRFNGKLIENAWLDKLAEALKNGYDGLRANGNESWLRHENWGDFMDYEQALDARLHDKRVIILCTYSLSASSATVVMDVAHAHKCAIAKRNGRWEILEEPEIKKIKAQLDKERKELEQQVKERTRELARLSQHLEFIREEERKYIAREIHDELGQYLTVLKMDLGSLIKKLGNTDKSVGERLKNISAIVDTIVVSVRRLASELRPSLLDELGLSAAIGWQLNDFESRSGIKTHFTEPDEEWELPEPYKTNLFRIVQESLTNVARHSRATDVTVTWKQEDGLLTLSIADNGIGFNPAEVDQKETLGILGMKERSAIIGGRYEIKTMPGKGTTISVTVPSGRKSNDDVAYSDRG